VVNGAGFSLSGVPKLPVGLAASEAFEFSVVFQATTAANYSASLEMDGLSAVLMAAVLPGLTNSVSATGIAFATVEAGSSVSRRVTMSNLTAFALPLPTVSVTGEAFGLGEAPNGVLQPSESASFDVVFASNRNAKAEGETNVFIAEWVD